MKYKYAFLKFDTPEQATDALVAAYPAETDNGDPTFVEQSHDHFIDVVGRIIDTQGDYDPETGEEITPPTWKEGWHVNVVLREGTELPDALKEFEVLNVKTPARTNAGVPYEDQTETV